VRIISTAKLPTLAFLSRLCLFGKKCRSTWDESLEKEECSQLDHFFLIFILRVFIRCALMASAIFLVADTQLYKRLCPSVRWSVGPSVGNDRVEKLKNKRFTYFLCVFVCVLGVGVWMGVGRPCPPVRSDIVTPRHLFLTVLFDNLLMSQLTGSFLHMSERRKIFHFKSYLSHDLHGIFCIVDVSRFNYVIVQ